MRYPQSPVTPTLPDDYDREYGEYGEWDCQQMVVCRCGRRTVVTFYDRQPPKLAACECVMG